MGENEYKGTERRASPADITLLSVKFDSLHSDVNEIKGAIREMTAAVNKLAVIEERLATAVSAQERAFIAIAKIDSRVTLLEQKAPLNDKTTLWIDRSMLFIVGAFAMFIIDKVTKG